MHKIKLRKALVVSTLLLIIVFSIASSRISLVQADKGGTGKYLTVKFDIPANAPSEDFYVTATKSNGRSWTFTPSDPAQAEKLGAGDVSLYATCPEGYVLSSWELYNVNNPADSETISGETNPIDFRSEKYAGITVHFTTEQVTLTVAVTGSGSGTVTVNDDDPISDYPYSYDFGYGAEVTLVATEADSSVFAGWDMAPSNDNPLTFLLTEDKTVTATFNLKQYTLTVITIGEGSVTPTEGLYDWGATEILEFDSEEGYHLASVYDDKDGFANLVVTDTFELSITFTEDHTITATFAPDGIAEVPAGQDVSVFLSEGASLTFDNVGSAGIALGTELADIPSDWVVLWEIRTTVLIGDDEEVLIILHYDDSQLPPGIDEEDLRIWTVDFIGDVTGDGVVNGQDVSTVGNANPSAPGDPDWDPFLDLNGDGFIDDKDVNIVNDHIGESLADIPESDWILLLHSGIFDAEGNEVFVDTELNLIFGVTDHFSIFRGR